MDNLARDRTDQNRTVAVRTPYRAAWGETWYRRILRWHQWPVYQAMGKLQGHVWVFRAGGEHGR
jgi:hypothetical protein